MRLQSSKKGKSRTKKDFKQKKVSSKGKASSPSIVSRVGRKLNAILKKARAFGVSFKKVTKPSKGKKTLQR